MHEYSDRPFVQCHLARQVRKMATYKMRANQFTEEQYDQFMAKCRTQMGIDALCEYVCQDYEFDWNKLHKWLDTHWARLRKLIEEFNDVDLLHPQMFYRNAPATRGRKALRALGPSYEEDPRFIEDRERFKRELRGEQNTSRDSYEDLQ